MTTPQEQQQQQHLISRRDSYDGDTATITTSNSTENRTSGGNYDTSLLSSAESAGPIATKKTTAPTASLTFQDFKIVRRIGSGDIGNIYLCRLSSRSSNDSSSNTNDDGNDDNYSSSSSSSSPSTSPSSAGDGTGDCYAMKVVDKEALAAKKKTHRAETERRIIKLLDHPFLPTLFAEFEASHFSCFVMEFCPGGDLHTLRDKQPFKRFTLPSARFYAAEVLVALEYLHMLGIIYRDLKSENVLVRSDGHIMLSDFDLSMCSRSIPAVHLSTPDPTALDSPLSSPSPSPFSRTRRSKNRRSTAPFSCLPNPLFRSRKIQQTIATNSPLFVAEPVAARSCSFVGTHEYVSPEVASGGFHGSAVD